MSMDRPVRADDKKDIELNCNDIVIVGDGPIALLNAITLNKKGVKNITVVGPRLGEFTRSGDVVSEVFTDMAEAAGFEIPLTPGQHIKDLERALYHHAKTLDIKFIKKSFFEFGAGRQLLLKDKKEEGLQKIHADLVIDCTGTQRAVLGKINQIIWEKEKVYPFHLEHIGREYPHNTYALVRVFVPSSHVERINDELSIENLAMSSGEFSPVALYDPISYAMGIHELRKLNWDKDFLPYIYSNPSGKPGKLNIYMQVPDSLTDEQDLLQFVKIMLKLNKNYREIDGVEIKLHKPSTKWGIKKPIASLFRIVPQKTREAYYKGSESFPVIFHSGDCSA